MELVSVDLTFLFNCTKPLNEEEVLILDKLVEQLYSGTGKNREFAHQSLNDLKTKEDSWLLVNEIMQYSKQSSTKHFALTLLEDCIHTKWRVLTLPQRNMIKQVVTRLAVDTSQSNTAVQNKIFTTLVQIVKQDWPQEWNDFVPELCNAARTNQNLCENVMKIFSMLSEEVFEFGEDVASKKLHKLMTSLSEQFQLIFDLCIFVIQNYVQHPASVTNSLIITTLNCLSHFLKWIPFGFILNTDLISSILDVFWETIAFRINCLKCLAEIAQIESNNDEVTKRKLTEFWLKLMQKLKQIPLQTIEYEKNVPSNARPFWENFYQQVSLCLTCFIKNHRIHVCEEAIKTDSQGFNLLLTALNLLIKITDITHDCTQKICIDFWHDLGEELVLEMRNNYESTRGKLSNELIEEPKLYFNKLQIYENILHEVINVTVGKMSKPPEVYINYDEETGTIDREYNTDTEEISNYNILRESLIYLSNLIPQQMQHILEELLSNEMKSKDSGVDTWNPMPLNRVCWAIGAISGSMSLNQEKTLLIKIIKQLLHFCEVTRGKANKAIVASQIMYIIGQYPRFLNLHWKLISILMEKLLVFMQEKFPGVQDMACETFLKVCQRCGPQLVKQPEIENTSCNGETLSMNMPLIESITQHILKLHSEFHGRKQLMIVYEALAHAIRAAENSKQINYMFNLLSLCNNRWKNIIQLAMSNKDILNENGNIKIIIEILSLNERVCYAIGHIYTHQMNTLFTDLINLYKIYSESLNNQIQIYGYTILNNFLCKQIRQIKKSILILLETYISSCCESNESLQLIKYNLIPQIFPIILEDYKATIAKDRELISFIICVIRYIDVSNEISFISQCVFQPTVQLIQQDFYSYTEIRNIFFNFLEESIKNCFDYILHDSCFNQYIPVLLWGAEHSVYLISEQALRTIQLIITKLMEKQPMQLEEFFRTYYHKTLETLLTIMTDTTHTSTFNSQVVVLRQLIMVIDSGLINDNNNGLTKGQVSNKIQTYFQTAFTNLNSKQIEIFIIDLFNLSDNQSKTKSHIKDFLLQLKEFGGADYFFEVERAEVYNTSEQLRQQKQLVPGYVPQWDSLIIKFEDNSD